jgi:hypothetical protein
MAKWIWRLYAWEQGLWANIVCNKYLKDKDLLTDAHRSGSQILERYPKIKHVLSLGAKHNVRNVLVAEIFQDNTFRVTFRRELGFGERVEWDNLSRLVEGLTLSEPRDLISWSLEPSGSFSVRSLYKRMCQGIPHKHFGVLWGINAPLEVRIFLWQLAEKRLQSNENIRKRRALPMGVVPCVGRWKTTSTFSSAAH